MKQLLIIASLLISLNASAADFTDNEKRHFENQCKDILNEVVRVFNDKHPNPKLKKHDTVIDTIAIWDVIFRLSEVLVNDERKPWVWKIDPLPRNHVDFRWSDDKRALVVVASVWGDKFFDKIEDGQTLKDQSIKVGVFKDIRIKPTKAELIEERTKKDYPRWFSQEITLWPDEATYSFSPYSAHNGKGTVHWDLWLDPDTMSPPFHGWFTWHARNQLLALHERWPGFFIEGSDGILNPHDKVVSYDNFWNKGTLGLEVRTTRRKVNKVWKLTGNIEFDSEFFVYVNLKRFNGATFSYKTRSYSLNRCKESFGDTDELIDWIDDNGGRDGNAKVTIQKTWSWEIDIHESTNYSGTREKLIKDLTYQPPLFDPFPRSRGVSTGILPPGGTVFELNNPAEPPLEKLIYDLVPTLTDLQVLMLSFLVEHKDVSVETLVEEFPGHEEEDIDVFVDEGIAEWVEVSLHGGGPDLHVRVKDYIYEL